MNLGISIVICCYNSSEKLAATLKYLVSQKFTEALNWEVIIIDNASTDNTALKAKIEWDKLGAQIDFRIVEESNPGLNNARYRGAKEAIYEWILFCDDDNWLEEDYLHNLCKIFKTHPDLSIIGAGIASPVYEVEPKKWFYKYKHLCAIFNLRDEGLEEHFAYKRGDTCWIAGAGMCIKTKLLFSYFRDETFILTDRKGDSLSSGGDSDIINYALKLNYQTGQFTKLKLYHYIPKARLTKNYIKRLTKGMSFTYVLLTYKEEKELIKPSFIECIYKSAKRLIKLDYFGAQRIYYDYLGKIEANKFIFDLKENG
jgi:glycosyltransferase involved in cell wall biosynthesis